MHSLLFQNIKIFCWYKFYIICISFFSFILIPQSTLASSKQKYYYNKKGCEVKELQAILRVTGTGLFDLRTAEAVARFQRDKNLRVTGVVDSSTLRALQIDPLFNCKVKNDRPRGTSVPRDNAPRSRTAPGGTWLQPAPILSSANGGDSVVVNVVNVSVGRPVSVIRIPTPIDRPISVVPPIIIDRPVSVRPPVIVETIQPRPGQVSIPSGSYTVVIPGSNNQLLNHIRQYVPGAFVDTARQGSFVNAGRYSFDYAQSVSSLLRSKGFDARVVYLP